MTEIVDFREGMLPQHADRLRDLALTQMPDTFFITCSDGRVAPNLWRRLAQRPPSRCITSVI